MEGDSKASGSTFLPDLQELDVAYSKDDVDRVDRQLKTVKERWKIPNTLRNKVTKQRNRKTKQRNKATNQNKEIEKQRKLQELLTLEQQLNFR